MQMCIQHFDDIKNQNMQLLYIYGKQLAIFIFLYWKRDSELMLIILCEDQILFAIWYLTGFVIMIYWTLKSIQILSNRSYIKNIQHIKQLILAFDRPRYTLLQLICMFYGHVSWNMMWFNTALDLCVYLFTFECHR